MDTDLPRQGQPSGAGELLGERYRLEEVIGAGGMAVVWQAQDTVLERTVAVKTLRHAGNPQSRAQVMREARAAAALAHPNIAQVYDYGESVVTGGLVPYVVLELVRGPTLQQRLKSGEVTVRFALRICAEVGAALAAAHAERLVHRDIKPANVMLASTGVKVVDFGIAAAIAPGRSGEPDPEIFGTPSYIAPERLTHDAVEPASDIYALGVLLYRLLSGHTPWPERSTTRLLAAHLYEPPPPLVPRSPVPDQVLALVALCLAKDPTQRPSAREATQVLAAAAGLQVVEDSFSPVAGHASANQPSIVVRPPRRGRRRLALALAIAAAVGGAATASALLPRNTAPVAAPPSPAALGPPSSRTSRQSVVPSATESGRGRPGPSVAPAGPRPATPGPTGTARPPAADTPSPTTTPPTPVTLTLTSPAGTVTARCPAATTAQIVSWTATKPFKAEDVDDSPGPAPSAEFRHGTARVTMTITCTNSRPSADVT
jgi:serine/threonine protein kinase